jgi:DNA polymerase-3 subunit alpha
VINNGTQVGPVQEGTGPTCGIIRFGLYTIKNLGTDISNAIIEERKTNGAFKSIGDFLDRVTHKNVNKKSLEALIKSGAMDELGDRGTLYGNIESMLEYNKEAKKVNTQQDSLFGGMDIGTAGFKMKETTGITKEEKLMWEKELLGLYISGHPLDKIREKLENMPMNIKKVHEAELPVPKEGVKRNRDDGLTVTIAGIIETVRIVMTKKNEQMAFIKISDFTGSIEAVVFPKLFADTKTIFQPDVCIVLVGKVTLRNDEKSIVIERVKKI